MKYRQPLTAREQAHMRRWLSRHGAAGREATPVLAARLAARYRALWIEGAFAVVVTVLLLGYAIWNGLRQPGPGPGPDTEAYLIVFLAAYALHSVGTLAALWYRRRADRQIGQALPRRVARSAAGNLRGLLGRWFVVAAAAIYGGGLLAGAAGVAAGADGRTARALGVPAGADNGSDQAVGIVILATVVVFAVFAVVVLIDVTRRPAVAEDEVSLVDDEVLRREDAHRALTPFLPLFALIAAVTSRSGDGLLLIYLGYGAASGILLAVAVNLANRARAGTAGAAGVAAGVRS